MSTKNLIRLFLSLTVILGIIGIGKAQEIDWIRQFGTPKLDDVICVFVDSSGLYVGGGTSGTLPGQSYAGKGDAFVRKYDFNGNEIWTRQFGGSDTEISIGLSVDSSGLYIIGRTSGTFPGQVSSGGMDVFVRKYDHDGNEIWTRQFGSTQADYGGSVSIDPSGIYVAGSTWGILPGQSAAGGADAFVRKYDFNGNEIWTRQFGSSGDDGSGSVTVDSSGVYIAGGTNGILPGQSSAGLYDVFLRKYDHHGNEVWTKQFGSSEHDSGASVTADPSGIYITGVTHGIFPGQNSAGQADVFAKKLDHNGNEVWTRQLGSSGGDYSTCISADSSGLYLAGYTRGTFPGHSSAGGSDLFVIKCGFNGNEVWTWQFGGSGDDYIYGSSVDPSGIYVGGDTWGTLPNQSSVGPRDAFIVKLSETSNTPTGNDVVVQPVDSASGESPVTLTFFEVTEGGETTLNISPTGAPPPSGFKLGSPPRYYEIETTATYTGSISICIDYSGIEFGGKEENLKLFHRTDGGHWEQVSTTIDTNNNIICGDVLSLSAFAIFEPMTLDELIEIVQSSGIHKGVQNSLLAKLQNVQKSLEKGNINAALNQIEAFQNEVRAQSGKKIPSEIADEWIEISNVIMDAILN